MIIHFKVGVSLLCGKTLFHEYEGHTDNPAKFCSLGLTASDVSCCENCSELFEAQYGLSSPMPDSDLVPNGIDRFKLGGMKPETRKVVSEAQYKKYQIEIGGRLSDDIAMVYEGALPGYQDVLYHHFSDNGRTTGCGLSDIENLKSCTDVPEKFVGYPEVPHEKGCRECQIYVLSSYGLQDPTNLGSKLVKDSPQNLHKQLDSVATTRKLKEAQYQRYLEGLHVKEPFKARVLHYALSQQTGHAICLAEVSNKLDSASLVTSDAAYFFGSDSGELYEQKCPNCWVTFMNAMGMTADSLKGPICVQAEYPLSEIVRDLTPENISLFKDYQLARSTWGKKRAKKLARQEAYRVRQAESWESAKALYYKAVGATPLSANANLEAGYVFAALLDDCRSRNGDTPAGYASSKFSISSESLKQVAPFVSVVESALEKSREEVKALKAEIKALKERTSEKPAIAPDAERPPFLTTELREQVLPQALKPEEYLQAENPSALEFARSGLDLITEVEDFVLRELADNYDGTVKQEQSVANIVRYFVLRQKTYTALMQDLLQSNDVSVEEMYRTLAEHNFVREKSRAHFVRTLYQSLDTELPELAETPIRGRIDPTDLVPQIHRVLSFKVQDETRGLLDYLVFSYDGSDNVGYVAHEWGTARVSAQQLYTPVKDIEDTLVQDVLKRQAHFLFDDSGDVEMMVATQRYSPYCKFVPVEIDRIEKVRESHGGKES